MLFTYICTLIYKQYEKMRKCNDELNQTVLELNLWAITFVLPSTGFELTPLIHCSTNRLALCSAFCTFSFEFKESSLSDTRCLIQDVVSPHCGDKRKARRCTRSSLPNYFVMTSYHWIKHINVSKVNKAIEWTATNVTSCTKCNLPQSIVHIC
jgi:hypothetical protein